MGRSRLPARMANLVFGGVFFTVGLLFPVFLVSAAIETAVAIRMIVKAVVAAQTANWERFSIYKTTGPQ